MRTVSFFIATAAVSLLLGLEQGLADDPVSQPGGVVYLQRSSEFVVPFSKNKYDCYRGPLMREMQRQAFSIAARDQLGVTTRDAWLGDWMPTEGNNEPFEMVMFRGPPATLEKFARPCPTLQVGEKCGLGTKSLRASPLGRFAATPEPLKSIINHGTYNAR